MNKEYFDVKRNINKKYIYFSILGVFLLIGVTYALVFYMEEYRSNALGLVTDLVSVDISEEGKIAYVGAIGQKDNEGIKNDKTKFMITNNNNIGIKVVIKLVSDSDSTISTNNIRSGVMDKGEKILDIRNLGENNNIVYEFFMNKGESIELYSTIWLDYYYTGYGERFSGTYKVEVSNIDEYGYMYLTHLVGKNKGLYAINEDNTLNNGEGNIKEYRYSGLNPDNYVMFNNELWRIIGIVDGNIKIVKDTNLASTAFGSNNTYSESAVETVLNNYYNSLNKKEKDLIEKKEYNVGSINLTDTITNLLTNEQSLTYKTNIGLINASDYLYSTNPSYYTNALNNTNISSNTWLEGTYLTINPITGNTTNVLGINANIPTSIVSTDTTYSVKPCLYLRKDVSIIAGNGTETRPYELSLENKVNDPLPPTAAETIIENVVTYSVANPTSFTGGLVAVNTGGTLYNETDTTQTIREYRYSGSSVNNYVYFNCADTAGGYNYGEENYPYNETNCELWRIVGIFKNEQGEWNIKLMRNTVLQASELVSTYTYNGTTYNIQYSTDNIVYWNYKTSGTNNNDWTTAGLQYFLNIEQDTNGTSGYYSSITATSKSLIDDDYKYHLGNVVYGSSGDTTVTAYDNERKTTVCASSVTSDSHSSNCYVWYGNQPNWNGAIGLLYPSDVGYAAHSRYWSATRLSDYVGSALEASSWMMQNANHSTSEWTISPSSNYSDRAMYWYLLGSLNDYNVEFSLNIGARPVLNLKSETTSLAGRDGSIDLPYVFVGR